MTQPTQLTAVSTDVKLAVNLGGLHMKNPATVASGTFAAGREYSDFVDVASLGAVTTKGVSLDGWEGNEPIRIAETPSGMLNSIGLQNPGVNHMIEHDLPWLASHGATSIVNVSGHSIEEYVRVIEQLEARGQFDALELNISCPNVDAGGMTFGTDPDMVRTVVSAARSVAAHPLIVKLTPNVGDIKATAAAAEEAGADAISLINTILGMAIDAHARNPILARKVGGLSGPAIKPVALRMVWEASQAVSIPILGMGGISSGIDAAEFMLAGATAFAVGTANFTDPAASVRILNEFIAFCEAEGVSDVNELIGALA